MRNVRSFPLAQLARSGLLAAALGGCALTVTACSSSSAAPAKQAAANADPTSGTAPATTPPTADSPPPVSVAPSIPVAGSPGAVSPPQPSAQQDPPAPPSGPLTAKLVGLPTSITMGSAPVQFQAVISNPTTVDYPSVAPVFQIVGGPANHVNATLQKYDPVSHTWQNTTMPEGDGANPLTFAAHGQDLAPGHSLTITYRLTVPAQNPAEPTAAILYAAALPGDTQLAQATIRGRIIAP